MIGYGLTWPAGRALRRPSVYSFSLVVPRPPTSALFPYTTLFRSYDLVVFFEVLHDLSHPVEALASARKSLAPGGTRSEEHTSELQSREKLVCRLLLEKKNKFTRRSHPFVTVSGLSRPSDHIPESL